MVKTSQRESRRSVLKAIGLFACAAGAQAQVIGDELCACTPTRYEFTLDFTKVCPPTNVTLGDGIASASCLIGPFGDPSTSDLVPVAIDTIDILELGQDVKVIVKETLEGEFIQGDTFDYQSITSTAEELNGAEDIPRAIQINLNGRNAGGEGLINVFIISFTNSCDVYPVLQENESAGWAVFVSCPPTCSLVFFDLMHSRLHCLLLFL